MNCRNSFQTHILLLLLLLVLPALACNTLLGDSDDGESAGSVVESQEEATSTEQDSPSELGAEESVDVEGEAGEAAAGSDGEPSVSRETIVSALRTGLEIDRMRVHVTSEDLGGGAVSNVTLAFVRPDRYHLVSQELEVIVVEDTTYLKGPNGKWTTVPGTEMVGTVEGTLAAFAGDAAIQERLDTLSESDVTLEGRETINGVETQIYSIDEGPDGSSIFGRAKMWIGVEDGLLYRQEVETELGGVGSRTTMEFEYGDDVSIEPPAP
jgi:hypothetical protein